MEFICVYGNIYTHYYYYHNSRLKCGTETEKGKGKEKECVKCVDDVFDGRKCKSIREHRSLAINKKQT